MEAQSFSINILQLIFTLKQRGHTDRDQSQRTCPCGLKEYLQHLNQICNSNLQDHIFFFSMPIYVYQSKQNHVVSHPNHVTFFSSVEHTITASVPIHFHYRKKCKTIVHFIKSQKWQNQQHLLHRRHFALIQTNIFSMTRI